MGECFQAVIRLSEGCSFSLEWDIDALLSNLKQNRYETIEIPLSENSIYSDGDNVDSSKVERFIEEFPSEPILLVWLEIVKKYYVIDGNHRWGAASLASRPSISGVILPPSFHLRHMLSDASRIRYKIFHNTAIIINILAHPDCEIAERADDRNALYPITGNKLKLGRLRHILLCLYALTHKKQLRLPE